MIVRYANFFNPFAIRVVGIEGSGSTILQYLLKTVIDKNTKIIKSHRFINSPNTLISIVRDPIMISISYTMRQRDIHSPRVSDVVESAYFLGIVRRRDNAIRNYMQIGIPWLIYEKYLPHSPYLLAVDACQLLNLPCPSLDKISNALSEIKFEPVSKHQAGKNLIFENIDKNGFHFNHRASLMPNYSDLKERVLSDKEACKKIKNFFPYITNFFHY
jgi:hypothetical protein